MAVDSLVTSRAMRRSDFAFELPSSLIAQEPAPERSSSRLLEVGPGSDSFRELSFRALPTLLMSQDLLVLNDTRVIKARLTGIKESGGRVEILVDRVIDPHRCHALIRASRSPRPGARVRLDAGVELRVLGRRGEFFELELVTPGRWADDENRGLSSPAAVGRGPSPPEDWWSLMEAWGQVPLPPYVQRSADERDAERYQTVFAQRAGAVAAPTAGLHFDQPLLAEIQRLGVDIAWLTLHVGAGTFAPVRVDDVSQHRMHAERVFVPERTCAAIRATRSRGGRVVAVGTTCVRALEAAAAQAGEADLISEFEGETDLFIYPGHQFRIADCMVTNFHLPQSTLLMLVSAFSGRERMLAAYQYAVARKFRFFSYGDACFLHRASAIQRPGLCR